MALHDLDKKDLADIIEDFLREKSANKCEACGVDNWGFFISGENTLVLTRFADHNIASNKFAKFYAIGCQNCGNARFIDYDFISEWWNNKRNPAFSSPTTPRLTDA